MYCITRYEMKFGKEIIPARTKAILINKVTTDTVDAPGVYVKLAIDNYNLHKEDINNENEVIKYHVNANDATLGGIIVNTNTQAVYMDAGDKFYYYTGLYDWQLEKIFGKDNIPKKLLIGKYKYNGKDAKLSDLVNYLDDEFMKWVENNCEFCILSEEDIESGDCFDGAEAGDSTLSAKGLEQFHTKKLEYQKRLETTGFTYNFKGGLNWD
ncbi:hypothetical protein KYB31_05515 [Clostridium felsineum]|uniref:hypothetical protein n=1 Tax=Clostridium felsineum TaxID=36839 RepID=UPI00214D26DA|nr:hypothetical protein [Clostridium felsineum]MCR3758453.1 hypothetical protein [Clostridium felsineum]